MPRPSRRRYAPAVRYVLLVLAIPFAVAAYVLTGQVLTSLGVGGELGGLLIIFLPLFIAGLVAVPFIAPFVDYKAKQALADAPSRRDAGDADGAKDTTGRGDRKP